MNLLVNPVSALKAVVWGLIAALISGALGTAGGVWMGIEWQRGREARADVRVLEKDRDGLIAAADKLRQSGIAIAQDFRTSQRRMETIQSDYQQQRDANRDLFNQQRDAWDVLRAAHPEIDACDIGADGVQHWNNAARGPRGAAAKPAAAGGQRTAPAVPAKPAGADRRNGTADPAHQRSSVGAVPRLRGRDDGVDRGIAGIRARGMERLLPGAALDWINGLGVQR